MRFSKLHIQNFKAIRRLDIDDLTDFILIAGPNGCGKSCVFDAIRLLKSIYGGYDGAEWMQWFGEFQIDMNDREQFRRLFRDPEKPVHIAATIELHDSEKDYLDANAERVVEPAAWALAIGQPIPSAAFSPAVATQFRQHGEAAQRNIVSLALALRQTLTEPEHHISLTIGSDLKLLHTPNFIVEMIFQTYAPDHLGVIEYHSASRAYQREAIGEVNLDAKHIDSQRRQQSLYNWQQKYANVKTQLATTYIRDLISRESGAPSGQSDLNETLKELFQTFFPDKKYLGVEPDPNGGLKFPVRTRGGQVHDINELSSGEKEVLYGYLWLRNSTPRNSMILLDEPELHLNPGLLRGFPDFYHKHLGKARDNQLWLVTHSDALLRQAVGNPNYSVFHMTAADTEDFADNQAVPITAHNELERATIDLVGDLAMYRPQGKVVLFEGGGDTDTDVRITEKLFPNFAKSANLVSGGSKQRVRDLYEVLAHTAERVGLARRFFAVTDRDSAPWESPPQGAHHLSWDAYHIENYLLEPRFVREAVGVLLGRPKFDSDDQVTEALVGAARDVLPGLVVTRLRKIVNDRIVSSVKLGGDPNKQDAAEALIASVEATFGRLNDARGTIDMTFLQEHAAAIRGDFEAALENGTWVSEIPGRSILQRFAARELSGAGSYEGFRNVIVDQMVDAAYEPPGMRLVIDFITATDPALGPAA
ncbi:hypothetical protein EHH44_02580 [Mycolicibacter terrae]|uniref:Uncharacterized protein n=1 Tax=Mycolicibacter terrae TaxID=1788 RepID=A0ACD2ESZ0_9MYCO|nr:AAA family ATPase [Mycolicibacter terrae]RRR48258.1 hypothetical protein EHH44_02580 [Mycolicibacter terrae]